jgi:hypothetical protein
VTCTTKFRKGATIGVLEHKRMNLEDRKTRVLQFDLSVNSKTTKHSALLFSLFFLLPCLKNLESPKLPKCIRKSRRIVGNIIRASRRACPVSVIFSAKQVLQG